MFTSPSRTTIIKFSSFDEKLTTTKEEVIQEEICPKSNYEIKRERGGKSSR
jgi:hypothetical protein